MTNPDGSLYGFQIVPVVIDIEGVLTHTDDTPSVYPVMHDQTVTVSGTYPNGDIYDIHITSNRRTP